MAVLVPAGIEYAGVSRFFAERMPGVTEPLQIELIGGGRSNLTYLIRSGASSWVLRRPPLGHVLPTAHDMAREFRVLFALASTDVPVPRPHILCEDLSYNGTPFYVMDYKTGIIVVEEIPPGYADTPAEHRRMSLALIDALVQLHDVNYEAVWLGDFGYPAGYVERQVRRWAQQWERSKTRDLPAFDEVMRRLRAAIPQSPASTIVHGDYRFGNMILAQDDPGRVEAILDWEMATLGDPLSDLGYTLLNWGDMDDPAEAREVRPLGAVTAQPGFLTRRELVNEYARRSGRSVDAIDFYQVLACYKLAVINEGIHARFLAGETVGEGFEVYGPQTVRLVDWALTLADASEDARLRGESG